MIHNALELESRWIATVLMATKEMLKFGYQLGESLDAVGCGSPALIKLSDNKGRFSLGYKPTHEELFQASRGSVSAKGCLFPISRPFFGLQPKSLC